MSLRITDQRASWGRAIFGTLSALCTFYALTSPRIHLADAVTLGATAPIFVALLAPAFLGEPRSRSVGLAVVIAFAGVALVLQPRFQSAIGVAAIATLGALLYCLRDDAAPAPGEPARAARRWCCTSRSWRW